jgi:hypothetical protein
MCFVGHGAFGVMTKQAWLPYFGVAGIDPDIAYRLMPVVGAVDIVVGTLMLICPMPAIGVWMTGWAIWTALLRPLAGESVWESFERAGNYGVPLALLLLLQRPNGVASFASRSAPRALDVALVRRLRISLTVALGFLLVGHGMLGLEGKIGQITNYASVFSEPMAVEFTRIAGAFEMLLAALVVVRPRIGLLLFVAAWKLGTESLFVTAGAPVWEVIERGGSYAAPIALVVVMMLQSRSTFHGSTGTVGRTELPIESQGPFDVQANSSPA